MLKSKFSDEKLLELYSQGLTNRQIADKLQVSEPAVHYRLGRLGLINNCQKRLFVDLQQVKILHEMGLTTIGIALLLKVNASTVSQHMRDLGLEDNYYKLRQLIA